MTSHRDLPTGKCLELQTERLSIEKLSEEDFDKVEQLQTHAEVMRFIGRGEPKTTEEVRQLFDMMLRHQRKHDFSLCPTYEKNQGTLSDLLGLFI